MGSNNQGRLKGMGALVVIFCQRRKKAQVGFPTCISTVGEQMRAE